MESQIILEVCNLTKYFPGTIAVNKVNLGIKKNSIHAIIGENGAGKSTFCKMITGLYSPDEGEMFFDEKKYNPASPSDSIKAGIGMVYQERNLIGYLTGYENICLGNEPERGILLSKKEAYKKACEIRDRLGVNIDLNIPVEKMGAGEQQIIEIMRAFYSTPQMLILDEPTASLGEGEIEPFLKFVTNVRDNMNISIIYISHKLEEIFMIADYVTVFTDGKIAMNTAISDTNMEACIKAMIRADKIHKITVLEKDFTNAENILSINGLEFEGKRHDVKFEIHAGEIVGFYGLVGSGRTESMEAVFGIRDLTGGNVVFRGEKIKGASTHEMIQKGMVLTPEKRGNGIFKTLSLIDNISNLFIDKLSNKFTVFNEKKANIFGEEVLKKNNVKYSDSQQMISELSGGNIQKIIIGRSVEVNDMKLLIVDEPTAGMDLGAKSEIYLKMRMLVDDGSKGVIFISSELDELFSVCNRIIVFHEGNSVADLKRSEFDKETILSFAVRGVI